MAAIDSSFLDRAIRFAVDAHSGSARKFSAIPYVIHPLEAMAIAATLTDDQKVLAATVLHDVVEDTGTPIDDIRREFGDTVADLVATETEDKHRELPAEFTWKRRKQESLQVLFDTNDINVKILWLADKLSNMRSFYRMYLAEGVAFWNKLHQNDVSEQKWYYESVLDATAELKASSAWLEYRELVEKIFEE